MGARSLPHSCLVALLALALAAAPLPAPAATSDAADAAVPASDSPDSAALADTTTDASATPSLSDEELSWIEAHGSIRVGFIVGDVNIGEVDEATGEVSGVIVDYIDFARDCLGTSTLEFEPHGYANMEAELDALASGEVDMIFKVPFNERYVDEYGLALSGTAMRIPYSAVGKPGRFDQQEPHTVAIIADNWVKKWYISACYPSWQIVDCDSFDQCVQLVRAGQADCFLVRTGTSRTYIKNRSYQVNMLSCDITTSFGVRADNPTLLSILNKTLEVMPEGLLDNALTTYDNETDSISLAEFVRDNLGEVAAGALLLALAFAATFAALRRSRRAEASLAEQVAVSDTLSRNFKNIYLVNLDEGTARILKFQDESHDDFIVGCLGRNFPYEGFLHRWIEQDVHPDDRASLMQELSVARLREVFAVQDEYEGYYRVLVDGKVLHYQYDMSKTGNGGFVVAGFQNVEAIIQEQLAAEKRQREKDEAYHRELIAAKQDAEKANASKTDFLRRMSHDIRTPINGIRGMVQIANCNMDDPARLRECSDKIWKATEQLLSLVNDVLDMNKLESGSFTVRHDPFDLDQVLDEVRTVTEAQAMEIGVRFEVWDMDAIEHRRLVGSPVYVTRIFMNFISNAIKYNRPGGAVRVWGRETSFDGATAWYEFTCEDDGIGMSEEFRAHAFEPFSQEAQSQARTKYAGSGLGLAISKSLIELLGGTVELESALDKGTRIMFRLPFEVDSAPAKAQEEVDYSGVMFDGVRVLLAEDNDLNAEIATFLLERHGMQVTWVENGQLAVGELATHPDAFDVVFMDVMMPVMDGLEATRKIRRELRCDVPIFAMTANAFIDDAQRSLDAGMNEHLTKPLREEDIVRALLSHVRR